MAVGSLVLGIIACALCIIPIPYGTLIGIVASIVGIILGAKGRKAGMGGKATAGMVLSIIALALNAFFFIVCTACVACTATTAGGIAGL